MAQPAADRALGTIRSRFADLIARTPGRGEFALRLATICSLVTLVAQTYEVPDVALSVYVVFFMLRASRTESVLTSVVLAVLISVLIGFLLMIASIALDRPPVRVSIMAGLSLMMLFLASASRLKPFASTIGLILAYGLDVLGKAPQGELATRALLYIWLVIAIPASVTIAANLLAGPAPRRMVERAIASRLRAAQAALIRADGANSDRVASLRRQGGMGLMALLHLAGMEKATTRAHLAALQQAVRSTDTLLMLGEAISRSEMPMAWRQTAADRLGEMAAIVDRGLYPIGIDAVTPSAGTAVPGHLALLAGDFDEVLVGFAIAPDPVSQAPKPKGGFFVPDAFSNPEHVRFAVKITAAAMGCYLFYSLTDWQGIHTCLITCFIVALDTAAETVEKLSLRVAGAAVGAALGIGAIVFLTPQIDRIGGLLVLIFVGSLLGGWVAAGGPRIAYAGFQFSFAFLLCVLQGSSPRFDLTIARDRVIGIMIGNAAVFLVSVTIWPASIARRVDGSVASLFRGLAGVARLPTHGAVRDALPGAHAAVPKALAELEIATFEPRSMRRSEGWFRSRAVLVGRLRSAEDSLLVAEDGAGRGRLAHALDDVAAAIDREGAPDAVAFDTSLENTLAR